MPRSKKKKMSLFRISYSYTTEGEDYVKAASPADAEKIFMERWDCGGINGSCEDMTEFNVDSVEEVNADEYYSNEEDE